MRIESGRRQPPRRRSRVPFFARVVTTLALAVALPLAVAACDDAGTEPARLTLPMVADGSGVGAFTNDLGDIIELSAMRVAIRDIELTVGGETHSELLPSFRRLLVPEALAHPGHYAGGDVTGELPGRFIIDPFAGEDQPLGDATLLEGEYHGMNFTFRSADADDGLSEDDPLLGHTVVMSGVAHRGDQQVSFDVVLDIDEGTQMVGAPFTLDAHPGTEATLVLQFLGVDPSTNQSTVFDGVDLFEPGEETLDIEPGSDLHNILRRRIQVHDHWWVEPREGE